MTAPQQHHEDGYSLVELVVAMALLGMIALAVESGLHFGARVWERSQQTIGSAQKIGTSQTVLRNLLSHSLPRLKGDYVTFLGEPSTLTFDAVPPQAFETHGTAHVVLTVKRDGTNKTLVVTMQSVINPQSKKSAIIVDHVKNLKFAYLDASGKIPTWLAYWRDRKRLPDAIRIDSDNASKWPALIVRPLIAQSANCTLDPVSMTCRKT